MVAVLGVMKWPNKNFVFCLCLSAHSLCGTKTRAFCVCVYVCVLPENILAIDLSNQPSRFVMVVHLVAVLLKHHRFLSGGKKARGNFRFANYNSPLGGTVTQK